MNLVKELRKAARMTQAELSEATGIPQPNISAYESDRRVPSPKSLERVRRATTRRPSIILGERRALVVGAAQLRGVTRIGAVGSVARRTDRPDSDLNLIAEFAAGASLLDQAGLVDDLNAILGLPVTVASMGGLRDDERRQILAEMVPL